MIGWRGIAACRCSPLNNDGSRVIRHSSGWLVAFASLGAHLSGIFSLAANMSPSSLSIHPRSHINAFIIRFNHHFAVKWQGCDMVSYCCCCCLCCCLWCCVICKTRLRFRQRNPSSVTPLHSQPAFHLKATHWVMQLHCGTASSSARRSSAIGTFDARYMPLDVYGYVMLAP